MAGFSRKILKPKSFATYRLTVLLPPDPGIMGLNSSDVFFASQRIWVGDRLVHRNGDPSRQGPVYNFTGQTTVFFVQHGSRMTVTLQAGYLARSLVIGSHRAMVRNIDRENLPNTMVVAAILLMGLYHFALYWYRRKDRSLLFFGLACLFVPLYHLASNYEFTDADTGINVAMKLMVLKGGYAIVATLWFAAIAGIMFSAYFYLRSMFRDVVTAPMHRIAVMSAFLYILAISQVYLYSGHGSYLQNAWLVFILFTFGNAMILVSLVVCVTIMVRACMKKLDDSYIICAGIVFPVIGVLVDVMIVNGMIDFTKMTIWGLLLMFFTQSVVKARRFSMALGAEERLSGELRELNRTLEQKVEDRTAELQAANEEMTVINDDLLRTRDELWGEMQIAKKIQTILLPESPVIDGYEIEAYMKPADDVGGDYYDVIHSHGKDWIVVGDVSGHGVPAGLIMMMVQTSIQTVIEEKPDLPPHRLLVLVNRVITKNIVRLNENKYMTITVFACHDRGEFYFSGLHQDILVYRSGTGQVDIIETNGTWLGLSDDISGMVEDARLHLDTGDVMLLYTDGITESWARGSIRDYRTAEAMYGDDRLREVFRSSGTQPCKTIKDRILASLANYEFNDDITLVIVRRTGA